MKKAIILMACLFATQLQAAEPIITKLSVDNLERHIGDEQALVWDVTFWAGRDRDKFQLESDGERTLGGGAPGFQISGFYRRMISPFFDAKLGLRRDIEPGQGLTHLALGIEGLAPQWIELDVQALLSEDGDLTATLDAETDLRLTQNLILQPNVGLDWAAQKVAARGTGAGVGEVAAALRLRYQISRNIAPYLGWEWRRKFGGTARFATATGVPRSTDAFLIGVKGWF